MDFRALGAKLRSISPDTRTALFALSGLFYLVYVLNADNLRFSCADWNVFYNFLVGTNGKDRFWQVISNQWSDQPHIQTLTVLWWVRMSKIFGLWPAPYFAVTLTAHFTGAILLYLLL